MEAQFQSGREGDGVTGGVCECMSIAKKSGMAEDIPPYRIHGRFKRQAGSEFVEHRVQRMTVCTLYLDVVEAVPIKQTNKQRRYDVTIRWLRI